MRKNYPLRISPEVWAELERWAHDELRSVNGQIEFLLRQAIQARRGKNFASPSEPESSSDSENDGRSS